MSQPISRLDGPLKVTGAATYPAEFSVPNLAQAFAVMSAIARGKITAIDSTAAEKAAGVLAVITHLNAPKLPEPPNAQKTQGIRIEQRIPLVDDVISYGGQYVAVVVAETSEQARYAASLLRISYALQKPALRMEDALKADKPPQQEEQRLQKTKGDLNTALQNPEFVRIEQTYSTPTETHNPMEC